MWVKETSFDNPTSTARQWSVFDGKGIPLGIVDIPTDLQVFEIGRDHVLGVWTDDLGVEYVRMYDLGSGRFLHGLLIRPYEPSSSNSKMRCTVTGGTPDPVTCG